MDLVPEDGNILIHYTLPSGSMLELQLSLQKDESAYKVI